MILRFEVDQAAAFRQGVNVPKSTNHLDVDPAKLSQEDRNLIADRLDGIDVQLLEVEIKSGKFIKTPARPGDLTKGRVVAKLPTFDSLMEAVKANQRDVEEELMLWGDEKHKPKPDLSPERLL